MKNVYLFLGILFALIVPACFMLMQSKLLEGNAFFNAPLAFGAAVSTIISWLCFCTYQDKKEREKDKRR